MTEQSHEDDCMGALIQLPSLPLYPHPTLTRHGIIDAGAVKVDHSHSSFCPKVQFHAARAAWSKDERRCENEAPAFGFPLVAQSLNEGIAAGCFFLSF
eukprot:1159767-Pelagomonas_calceolata.AAC.4